MTRKPSREEALEAIRVLLSYIGEDVGRPGLLKTPERVIRAWEESWGAGYSENYIESQTQSILNGQFEDGAEEADEMIILKDIPFTSFCEHHLGLIEGKASVAYIPDGKILGLSKLARVVDLFASRLQVQERLTNQVANFLDENCKPVGVGVVMEATHSCISSRGVHKPGITTVTSALRGEMKSEPEVRAEFLRLIGR